MIYSLSQSQLDDIWALLSHGLRTIDRKLSLQRGTARRVLSNSIDEGESVAQHHAGDVWALLPRLLRGIDTALRLHAGTVRYVLSIGQHSSEDSRLAAQARYREHVEECARRRATSERHRFPNGRV